jgi:hypothetical protein
MSLEIAACVAFIQNRILVLPPEYRMYLLDNTNSMSTFFDINDIGIKIMSFEEFESKFNINGWDQIKGISYTIDEDLVNTLLTTTDEIPSEIIKGRNIKNITQIDNNQILYFDGNLLGNFYLNIHSDNLSKVCKYVARHIHYNKEIFLEAYKAVSLLGQYNAIEQKNASVEQLEKANRLVELYNYATKQDDLVIFPASKSSNTGILYLIVGGTDSIGFLIELYIWLSGCIFGSIYGINFLDSDLLNTAPDFTLPSMYL